MKSLDHHTCATYTNRELLIVQAIRKGMDTFGFLYYEYYGWEWKGCQSNRENRTANKEKETDNSSSYQCKIMLIPVPKLVEHKNLILISYLSQHKRDLLKIKYVIGTLFGCGVLHFFFWVSGLLPFCSPLWASYGYTPLCGPHSHQTKHQLDKIDLVILAKPRNGCRRSWEMNARSILFWIESQNRTKKIVNRDTLFLSNYDQY